MRFLSLVVFALLTGTAQAQVPTPQACAIFADMALTASAMARNGVKGATLRNVVSDIYAGIVPDEMSGVTEATVKAAEATGKDPREFAESFLQHCIGNAGRMEQFFGTDV